MIASWMMALSSHHGWWHHHFNLNDDIIVATVNDGIIIASWMMTLKSASWMVALSSHHWVWHYHLIMDDDFIIATGIMALSSHHGWCHHQSIVEWHYHRIVDKVIIIASWIKTLSSHRGWRHYHRIMDDGIIIASWMLNIKHHRFDKWRVVGWPLFRMVKYRAGNLLIRSLLIRSFCSNQMSDCERFAQITQDKWVTVNEPFRSLRGNERPWANLSGRSRQMSNSLRLLRWNEQFAQKILAKKFKILFQVP